MFIRSSPLLDILHCDFLYRAPWHDPLRVHPGFKQKNIAEQQNSLQGFTSNQTRLRNFARRRFFVIRLVQMRKIPSEVTNAMFPDVAPADFLSSIRPLVSRQELIISQFFRPTKLPAYPGSPTPMSASGAPGRTSPPASAQTAGSASIPLPSLTTTTLLIIVAEFWTAVQSAQVKLGHPLILLVQIFFFFFLKGRFHFRLDC